MVREIVVKFRTNSLWICTLSMRAVWKLKHKCGTSCKFQSIITGMAAKRPEFFELHGWYVVQICLYFAVRNEVFKIVNENNRTSPRASSLPTWKWYIICSQTDECFRLVLKDHIQTLINFSSFVVWSDTFSIKTSRAMHPCNIKYEIF